MDQSLPRPSRALVAVTQSLLGVLFLVGIGAAALLPRFSADVASLLPEYAGLKASLLTLALALIALTLGLLAVVALLVQRIRRGTILARSSLRWVDALVAVLACAIVLVIVGFIVISNGQAGSPFIALLQVMACLGAAALACVTLVLRTLLRHAILLRTELDEVI